MERSAHASSSGRGLSSRQHMMIDSCEDLIYVASINLYLYLRTTYELALVVALVGAYCNGILASWEYKLCAR